MRITIVISEQTINRRGNMSSHPCILCKRRRITCHGNCEFGQYFPANRYEEFDNACSHFGLSNILRNLQAVRPHERQATAESLLIEGTMWTNDPVRGGLGVVLDLESQISSSLIELDTLKKLLKFYRDQASSSNLKTSTTSPIPPQINTIVASSSTQIPNLAETVRHIFIIAIIFYKINLFSN